MPISDIITAAADFIYAFNAWDLHLHTLFTKKHNNV